MSETTSVTKANEPTPVLSLRDVVVYPYMVIPLFVGRERSILALDQAMNVDKRIVLVTQRSPDVDDPSADDLYEVGTLSTVLQLLRLPDGTTKVVVEGAERVRITGFTDENGYFEAEWEPLPGDHDTSDKEVEVAMRSLVGLFEQFVKLNRKIPPELLTTLAGIDDPSRLADTVAAHLSISLEQSKLVVISIGWPVSFSWVSFSVVANTVINVCQHKSLTFCFTTDTIDWTICCFWSSVDLEFSI